MSVDSDIIPDGDETRNLGSDDNKWKDIYCEQLSNSASLNTVTLRDDELLQDQPAGRSYWIVGKSHVTEAIHPQSPDSVDGEDWWVIENLGDERDWGVARYPIARGWKWQGFDQGNWTRTRYSGIILDNGTTFWVLTSGGTAETYTTTDHTPTRNLDDNNDSIEGLADVLGTLIDDLRAHGIVKPE